jgi:hypothetical protein
MSIDVYSFTWAVPEGGYKWIQACALGTHGMENKQRWMLTDGRPPGKSHMRKLYSPLTDFPGLYRTFAKLPLGDYEAILAFANQYGNLGIGGFVSPQEPTPPPGPIPLMQGEGRIEWTAAIDDMRQAVMIWDWFTGGDTTNLSRYIQWSDAEYEEDGLTTKKAARWDYDSRPDLAKEKFGSSRRCLSAIMPVLDLFKPRDVLMPASFLVQRWINDHLTKRAAPHLVYHLHSGKRVIQIVPDSLLTGMWLQFARAIEGNKEFRACRECGRWFELSHRQADGRTKRREFCSDPCKSKDYRKRKDHAAKELAAKPVSPKKRRLPKQ